MDELCRIHSSFDHLQSPPVENNHVHQFNDFGQSDDIMGGGSDHNILDILKDQISNHPLYPNLVSAYIDCRKVGAPPETATLLEEISKENHHVTSPYEVGVDPELDQFMKSYCEALVGYKEMLSKPLDESTAFFSNIVSQLNELCKENITNTTTSSFTSTNYHSDEAAGGTSDEEIIFDVEAAPEADQESTHESSGHGGEENELKEMLMRKYSGYLSSLRKEFLKKRKKGKLPKKATNALLDWWNTHYRWPYPTEEEKTRLSEQTGLDQKQINNWFINQRKRHWRPSEDMRFVLMQGFTSTTLAPPPMYHDVAGGGVAGNYGGTTTGNYESPS